MAVQNKYIRNELIEELKVKGHALVWGIGSFWVREYKKRKYQDPRTGQTRYRLACKKVVFKASPQLNKLFK